MPVMRSVIRVMVLAIVRGADDGGVGVASSKIKGEWAGGSSRRSAAEPGRVVWRVGWSGDGVEGDVVAEVV
jgi:hypothetical protein